MQQPDLGLMGMSWGGLERHVRTQIEIKLDK